MISVNIISITNCKATEIMYYETAFPQHTVVQLLDTIWHVAKLTVEAALLEDGNDNGRNTSEY
jgi:hypothetical protein